MLFRATLPTVAGELRGIRVICRSRLDGASVESAEKLEGPSARRVGTVPLSPRRLARDPVVVAALACAATLVLLYSLPLFDPKDLEEIGDTYAFVPLCLLVIVAARWRLSSIRHPEERRFWNLLALGFGFWLAAELFFIIIAPAGRGPTYQMVNDYLFVLFYLSVILATEESPHLRPGWSDGDPGHQLAYVETAFFALAALVYFAVIPYVLNVPAYSTTLPSFYLYVVFDLFLVGRSLYLCSAAATRRWRALYALFALSAVLLLATDLLDALSRSNVYLYSPGGAWDFLWYAYFFVVVGMARARHLYASTDGSQGVEASSDKEAVSGPIGSRSQYLFLLSLPVMHLALYRAGLLDAKSHEARDAAVVVYLIGIAVVAVIRERSYEKRNRAMRAEIESKNKRLMRAHRLEAVGQLAGGVAHEFNNLLTVILGHSDSLVHLLDDSSSTKKKAEEIKKAAIRAASLTRELLAFTRQQVMLPQAVDLNELIRKFEPTLRRVIGERISMELKLAGGIDHVLVDPGQIEHVLENLVENAHDAMPDGGRLTIRTSAIHVSVEDSYGGSPVKPGRYVTLSMSDTGVGMTKAVQARIFEPFFTTKTLGQGTGLGLATVYGIITQSGGHVVVTSEPGHGSTFKIFLPRHHAMTEEG